MFVAIKKPNEEWVYLALPLAPHLLVLLEVAVDLLQLLLRDQHSTFPQHHQPLLSLLVLKRGGEVMAQK